MSIILTAHSSVTLLVTFLTENTQFVVFESSDHIYWIIVFIYLFMFSSSRNFLTSCKVYWLASQEGLCSME